MIEFRSDSLRETSLFARKLLSEISSENKVISFSGCLGSGKTFICNEFLSHLNVEQLNSSSFQGISHYPGEVSIFHCDFFNHPFTEDDYELNILPYLSLSPWLMLVEWPNKLFHSYFEDIIQINISVLSNTSRLITVNENPTL